MKLLIYLYLCGFTFLYLGISGTAGNDASVVILVGVAFLAVAGALTLLGYLSAKRAENKEEAQKLAEDAAKEKEITQIAHLEGLNKYHQMDLLGLRQYQQGVDAMRELGHIVENSVHQEKEKDWAIHGGLAQGIAGPIAGVAAAVNTMQENERIREQNAANREWGRQQSAYYQQQANEAEKNRPRILSMQQLQQKYDVNLSWSPATLFSKLKITDIQVAASPKTGAVVMIGKWRQEDRSLCIDGSLRAKLYAPNGRCAGSAYMILPKNGTTAMQGNLFGFCTYPKFPGPYTVKIEPANLWELAEKGCASKKTDNLSDNEHRQLVKKSEEYYLAEMK